MFYFFCLLIAQALTGLFSLTLNTPETEKDNLFILSNQNKNVSKPHNSQLSMRLEVVSSSRLIYPNTFICLITGASTNSLGDWHRLKTWEHWIGYWLSTKKSSFCVKPFPCDPLWGVIYFGHSKDSVTLFFKKPDRSNILGKK